MLQLHGPPVRRTSGMPVWQVTSAAEREDLPAAAFGVDGLLLDVKPPGTMAKAVWVSGARAVNVSSGAERTRGTKDAALIRAFVAAARGALSSP